MLRGWMLIAIVALVTGQTDLLVDTRGTESERPIIAEGECAFKGDPHIYQFDANKTMHNASIFFKRTCSYILAQTNCTIPYCKPDFFVTGSFKFDKPSSPASSMDEIDAMIDIGEGRSWGVRFTRKLRKIQVFKLGYGNQAIQDIGSGKKLLKSGRYKHKKNTVEVKRGADMVDGDWKPTSLVAIASLANGAQIMYDGYKMAKIIVPPRMNGTLCGVCGNFDGDANNDLEIGYLYAGSLWRKGQCDGLRPKGPFQTQTRDTESFVTSWYWGGSTTGTCRDECETGRMNHIPPYIFVS
ncbi:hypothetical protein CAPTEDRAFT_207562 [Capitella teleta]|uniref:VWFD domain-containing protein n=1 Tax=Capitella teleta TaxID=283909 RepID=R7V8K8_CAPTE|nr:hypothetical protein CAPTEDRAFT_207562 [Capitella teleta]|eukprot:ELU14852.1 hypothetical protein CAPTEDRAFT_207562 [Capitella teleta]